MSKTFKKSARAVEEHENKSHFYKYKRSSIERQSHKHIDKYIKAQDIDKLNELLEYDLPPRK
ncbi:MAG: hypothetical protein EBU08_07690 [Micrococcales bacterium]|nr:hypothetical protein [Micrococcales bacterium]